jgi:hypothetical protein
MISMQYLVSVIDDTPNSATPGEMTDIDAFNEGLQAGGHWDKEPWDDAVPDLVR